MLTCTIEPSGEARFDTGGLFQARYKRAAVWLQAVAGAPVHAPVHRHQRGPTLKVAEGPVERLVAELRPGAADQDDIHRRLVITAGNGDAREILGDLPAVEQQAPCAWWLSFRYAAIPEPHILAALPDAHLRDIISWHSPLTTTPP